MYLLMHCHPVMILMVWQWVAVTNVYSEDKEDSGWAAHTTMRNPPPVNGLAQSLTQMSHLRLYSLL